MSDKKEKYLFAQKEFLKIIIAIIVLMIVSVAYYFYLRSEATQQAEKRAENTMSLYERMILFRMDKVETIVKTMRPLVEYALYDPDDMFGIVQHTLESNSLLSGGCIAFKADYYHEKGHWFETYYGYQNGTKNLISKQLGSPDHDYLEMDWFKKGFESEDGCWSDPYYDNAGGMSYMITYTAPIKDSIGEKVGVTGADITFDSLAGIVRSIKLYPNSYCTLVANDGTTLVGPPPTAKKLGKCHVYSQKIENKNITLTITIPDSDMYSRLRKSSIFFALVALIGILSVSFIAYHSLQNILKLYEVRIKEQHIEDELTIARNIQQSLLPSETTLKNINTVNVSGMQVPAKYVGGDLYDYYVRDNKLLFCIGDVSGKGVPAAMLMAISHSLFRTLSANCNDPEHIMYALNKSISENNPDIMFITLFLGIMDLSTGKINYCNAGHNPPIIIKGGQAKYLDTKPSLLLGVEANAQYTAYELTMAPGDTLFLYTDGLTEAENAQKEVFGDKRALEVASRYSTLKADEQIRQMQENVTIFANKAEQSDDLTMLAIHFIQTSYATSSLTMTNDINELVKLEPFVKEFFDQNKLDTSNMLKINLALEEALANVIMYAYPNGNTGEVTLEMKDTNSVISMEIRDKGVPFNPLQQKAVDLNVALEERRIGGLGIHLIKEIMDKVDYEYKDGSNILRMELRT